MKAHKRARFLLSKKLARSLKVFISCGICFERTDNFFIVPVNLKDKDAFHLTIEEYLQALISLIEELV